ncbi:MAG: hypothetical protein AB1765_03855 [Candidatus Hydrogenedentota bacterium]
MPEEIKEQVSQTPEQQEPEKEKKSSIIYIIIAAIIAVGLVFLIYIIFAPEEYDTTITTTITRTEPSWISDTEIKYLEVIERKEMLPLEAASDPDVVKAFGGVPTRYDIIKEEKIKNIEEIINSYLSDKPLTPEKIKEGSSLIAVHFSENNLSKLFIAKPVKDKTKDYEVIKVIQGDFTGKAGFGISPDGNKLLVISEPKNCIQVIFIETNDGPRIIEYQESKVEVGKFSY